MMKWSPLCYVDGEVTLPSWLIEADLGNRGETISSNMAIKEKSQQK